MEVVVWVVNVDEEVVATLIEGVTVDVTFEEVEVEVVLVDDLTLEVEEATCKEVVGDVVLIDEVEDTALELSTTATAMVTLLPLAAHMAAGVYTGIGIVTPYPVIPHAGLVGDVNPAGVAVTVMVEVKVVRAFPAVEVAAQYPVP